MRNRSEPDVEAGVKGGTYDGSVPSVEMAAASMVSISRAKGETMGGRPGH